MEKRRLRRAFGLLVPFSLCLLALAMPVQAVEVSADLVIQPKGEEAMSGKIYIKGDKVRQETTAEGETEIVIVRPDKKVSWTVTPGTKMYMEMPYQADEKPFEEWNKEKEKTSKYIGDETISGVSCKKYESQEEGEKVTFWVSSKYPFPLKVEDSESVMEYKNVKDGPLEDSLFEVPQGYSKMAMPAMPGKMDDEPKEKAQ